MDTFFLSHGSPIVSIDDTIPARRFFQSWVPAGVAGGQVPRAILMVSAHWETAAPAVSVVHGSNGTIYDFLGIPFPEPMYHIKYPAPGAPELAKRTKALLEQAGFGPVEENAGRGLDHGAWVPLMLMYPAADVPVCQLSVQPGRDAAYHYDLGRSLAPLREEGVLVLGSGAATHNMSLRGVHGAPPPEWAAGFDAWLRDALLDGRHDDVKRWYEAAAPHAELAHPQPDHLYPLHVALGAAGDGARAELIHHSWTGSLSYASYRFTTS
ncbi:hypothetical protein EJB05_47052, partial [Eragrostis curvula]